ncbi:MAG: threonine synthase, partial [Rickettsiales bacterium]
DAYKNEGQPKELAKLMKAFENDGKLKAEPQVLKNIKKDFSAYTIDDKTTCELIKQLHSETEETIDPHSIIGIGAGRYYIASPEYGGEPVVTLATAHPAKFPESIEKSGLPSPKLPEFLSDLMDKKEEMTVLENNLDEVKNFISQKV